MLVRTCTHTAGIAAGRLWINDVRNSIYIPAWVHSARNDGMVLCDGRRPIV